MPAPPTSSCLVRKTAGEWIGDRVKDQRDGQCNTRSGRGNTQDLVVVEQQESVECCVLGRFRDRTETERGHGAKAEPVC